MEIKILYKNNSVKDTSNLLLSVKEWYQDHGVFIDFITENKEAPHIYLEIKDGELNSGGAGATNPYGYENQAGGRRDKDNGWYPMVWKIKEIDANMLRVAIHEIMHCLHFQFDLGDIHSLPDGGNMGNGTIGGNEKAMQYFWENALLSNVPKKVIVHHTASKTWTYKETLDYHIVNPKIQRDIGYNYFIEKDGTIKRGRWIAKEGAHCVGQNTSSVGICLVGNFNEEQPTKEQLKSLKELINEYNLPVYFHRDFASTDCPGKNMKKELLNNMYQLIRKVADEDVYYLDNGFKVQIGDKETFNAFKGQLWGEWSEIKEISADEFKAIPKAGILIKTKSE